MRWEAGVMDRDMTYSFSALFGVLGFWLGVFGLWVTLARVGWSKEQGDWMGERIGR